MREYPQSMSVERAFQVKVISLTLSTVYDNPVTGIVGLDWTSTDGAF